MESKPSVSINTRRLLLSRLGALAGIFGPVVFWIISLVVASFYREYDPVEDTISALALRPEGWLQTIDFIIFGFLVMAFAIGLNDNIRKRGRLNLSLALLALSGLGMVIIAVFPTDNSIEAYTLNGLVHQYTTRIMGLIFPLSCILMIPSLKVDPRWNKLVGYTLATGLIALFLDGVWALGMVFEWVNHWAGLIERIIVFNSFVWVEVMSFRLLFLTLYSRCKPSIRMKCPG